MAATGRVEQTIVRLRAVEGLGLDMPAVTASGLDLSGDHPTFELMPAAREAVLDALDRGETHYADVPGIAPLRQAVGTALATAGLQVDSQNGLMITAGEQEARFLAIQTLAQAGYRLALPSVVHPGARKAAALGRTGACRFAVDPLTMTLDLSEVRRTLAAGRVALYLESPTRLTGKVIGREHLETIADEVRKTDGFVLWDASLAGWAPAQAGYLMIGTLPGMAERTITFGTLWPGLGLEDWLAAYLAGPAPLFEAARSLKQVIAICTTTPAQWGVLGALNAGSERHTAQRAVLEAQRAAAICEWPQGVLPGDASSVLAVRAPRGRVDRATLPARPMPGEPFGAPGVLRFTVTPTGDVTGAVRALAALDARKE
jgi:aspartate/methionine/tyrosine aminotransferase